MLQIEMPLTDIEPYERRVENELMPVAGVEVTTVGNCRSVQISLKGVISGTSAETLKQFLKGTSGLLANRWTIQMKDLIVISGRGLHNLVKFSKFIRQRGFPLVVLGINQNVYATLQDMKLVNAFAWAD